MATLTAIAGSGSVVLSDKNPYRLISIQGFGGADIRRVTRQGPAQHGNTDLGYRLGSRKIELVIGYQATSDALLDARRDTLVNIFRPSLTPLNLRFVRDDNEVRQVDCHVSGDIKIDLLPGLRTGHYQEAKIALYAPNPAWYELAPGTVTVTGTAGLSANWWLAGGVIDSGAVLMHGGTPTPGSAWSYAGTIGTASTFSLAFRATNESLGGASTFYAFGVDSDANGNITGTGDLYFGVSAAGVYEMNGHSLGTAAMPSGTFNYVYTYNPTYSTDYPNQIDRTNADDPSTMTAIRFWSGAMKISSATRKWRTNMAAGTAWSGAIPLYALYSPALSPSQESALNLYMQGAVGGTISQALNVPYEGDLPEYPTISITGPITGPTIVNTATGLSLSFGTFSIGAGTTYIINTHPDYRTVLYGTVNKRRELSSDSDLGDWRLEAAPVATGGTNTLSVTGTNTSSATRLSVVYYNRFMGP